MTLILNTTKQIPFCDLQTERFERYGITMVMGCEAEPMRYLCAAGTALRAHQDVNGFCFCYLVVPDNGPLPWLIFNAIAQELDSEIERMVDGRGRVVTSLGKQAVMDFLGHDHSEQGELILAYINGGCPDLQPGSVLC